MHRSRSEALLSGPQAIGPCRTLGLLTTREASQVRTLLDADVELYDYTISEFAIRHVLKEHGDLGSERARGQRAVTAADHAHLPQLLARPDSLASDRGDLLVEKQIGRERYGAVFRRLAKRRMLTLVTSWIGG